MGITCSSKTARELIKVAGIECDRLVLRILEFQEKLMSKRRIVTREDMDSLMEQLSRDPYLYIGQNSVPHKLVLNGKLLSAV